MAASGRKPQRTATGPGRVKTRNQARAAELYTRRRVLWLVESIRELCRVWGSRCNGTENRVSFGLDTHAC